LAETNIPVIVYNNPARVSVDISLSTFESLAQKEKIMGIKDSHPDIARVAQMKLILEKLKESQKMPKTKFFSLLCGDSPVFAAYLGMGGHGCISVTANILPHLSASLFKAWEDQDLKAFHAFRDQLMPMDMALQCESNPTPVKCAASLLGFCNNELKFPLKPVTKTNESSIQALLKGYDFKLPFEELQKKSA
jgi:4-hydroxy-tetrahydrodipicolinate synthase